MSGGGNIAALVARIERLGASALKERVAAKQRDAAHAECILGFVEQRNPYGTPWAPRKDKRGTWPILQKTGRGVESLTATSGSDSVRLRIVGYMKYTRGTNRMIPRLIFPEPLNGLGQWFVPIRDAAATAVREIMQ